MCVGSLSDIWTEDLTRRDRVWTRLQKTDPTTRDLRFFTVESFLEFNEQGALVPYIYLVEYVKAMPFCATVFTVYQFGSWIWHNLDNLHAIQETSILHGDREPITLYDCWKKTEFRKICSAYFLGRHHAPHDYLDEAEEEAEIQEEDIYIVGMDAALRCSLMLLKDDEGGRDDSVNDFMINCVRRHTDTRASHLGSALAQAMQAANTRRPALHGVTDRYQ